MILCCAGSGSFRTAGLPGGCGGPRYQHRHSGQPGGGHHRSPLSHQKLFKHFLSLNISPNRAEKYPKQCTSLFLAISLELCFLNTRVPIFPSDLTFFPLFFLQELSCFMSQPRPSFSAQTSTTRQGSRTEITSELWRGQGYEGLGVMVMVTARDLHRTGYGRGWSLLWVY